MAALNSRTTGRPTVPVPVRGADEKRKSFAEFVPHRSASTIIAVAVDVVSAAVAVAVGAWWSSRMGNTSTLWLAALFVPIVVSLLWLQGFYRRRLNRSFIDQLVPVETNIALAAILPMSVVTFGEVSGPSAATSPGSGSVLRWSCRRRDCAMRRFGTDCVGVADSARRPSSSGMELSQRGSSSD